MKRIFALALAALLCALLLSSVASASGRASVVDDEGLFTEEERAALEQRAQQIAEKYNCDVYLYTVRSLGGMDAEDYACDLLEGKDDSLAMVLSISEGGAGYDGVGVGVYVLTDENKYDLNDRIRSAYEEGDYAGCFYAFLDLCEHDLGEAWELKDAEEDAESRSKTKRTIAGAVAAPTLGFLFAGIPVSSMKRKNSNVSKKVSASNYAGTLGLNLSIQQDRYLRTNTTRTPISTDSGSRGGGGGGFTGVGGGHVSTHVGSSGTTHSSGGIKF